MEDKSTTGALPSMGVLDLHASVLNTLLETVELQEKTARKLVDDLKLSKTEVDQTKKDVEKLISDLSRSKSQIDQTKEDLKRVDHFIIGFVIVIGLAFIATVVTFGWDYILGQKAYDYYVDQVMELNSEIIATCQKSSVD